MARTRRHNISPEKRANAYWDLRGLIAQWMEEYDQDELYTMLYLQRIVASLTSGLQAGYEWRIRRLERVLELPAGAWELPADPDQEREEHE